MPPSQTSLFSCNCESSNSLTLLSKYLKSYPRYVNRDREITKRYVQNAEKRGVKALFITVDAPQLGRREKDMRMKFVGSDGTAKVQDGMSGVKKDEGVARAISVWILLLL